MYADKVSFEWTRIEGEQPILHVGEKPERVNVPDYARLLPEEIQRFTTKGVYDDEHAHLSFIQGGGYGGPHPHLVHEFVSSIVEDAAVPRCASIRQLDLAGICAHESALQGGQIVQIPEFRELKHGDTSVCE